MKKDIRVFASLALIVLMGTSALPALSQERQPAAERSTVERERAAQAQEVPASAGPDRAMFERELVMSGIQDPGMRGDFLFLATEMSFGGKLVKNAPYSAQAVTESVQTLTDGNRIVNKSTAAVYRDSEGRTRREQTLKAIGPFANSGEPTVSVFINDPVAGTSYSLEPRTHTARKMMPMRFKMETKPRIVYGRAGDKGLENVYREAPGQVILEKGAPLEERYRVTAEADEVKRSLEAGSAMGFASTRNRAGRTESVGKQFIGGVEAEGTRTTVTIPAGEIGNERPIEIVSERWYSPELQIIVMTRHSDPRFGENSYQLTNINRSEPARDLFEVPAGYTVNESYKPAMGTGTWTSKGGVGAVVGGTGGGVVVSTGGGVVVGTGGGVWEGVNGPILNGKAIRLPKPEYPEIARAAKASGTVHVQITIDEEGNVIAAESVTGHPLLRAAALNAAREAKFSPTKLNGQAVKVNGVVVYNFVAQ